MSMKVLSTLAVLAPLAASNSALAQQPVPYQQPTYQPPPAPTYQQPPPTYQQPAPTYQQPAPTYQPPPQQPPPQQPPPNYQQPPPNYQQPPPNYQQPPPSYQQPPANYQQPPGYYPPPYQQPPPPYQQPPPAQQAAAQQQSAKAQPKTGIQYHAWRFQIEGGYTITEGAVKDTLDNGGNVGVGVTWFPFSALPLGFRADANYSRFYYTQHGLDQESANFPGVTLYSGEQNIYGGDADAELDLKMGPNVKEYFFGGVGRYKTENIFKQAMYESGQVCNFLFCTPGQVPVTSVVSQKTSGWQNSWNAGMGFEFSLGDPLTLFIDARYVRIGPNSGNIGFVPIRVGLRF